MDRSNSCQDIFQQLREERDANPDLYITVPDTPLRTLLLIGPTRAGKSTICETLQDTLRIPESPSLSSSTRNPGAREINGLRIIDTRSFNNTQLATQNSSSGKQSIVATLQEQLTQNYPVHFVAFVIDLVNGIKEEDINTMILIQSNFPDLAVRMMLVVTHAEELNREGKDQLIKEFFQQPVVRQNNLRNFFEQGILFLGCLRYESYKQRNRAALRNEHQNVLEMRKKFIEKCFTDVPRTNEFQLNIKNRLSPYISRVLSKPVILFVALLIIVTCLSYVMYSKPGGQDPSLVSSIDPKDDRLCDKSVENSTDNNNSMESSECFNNPKHDNISNTFENDKSIQLESNLATNEILMKMLEESKMSNERLRNMEKQQDVMMKILLNMKKKAET
jgi:GTP-binding protein EngB required for normal cell division